MKRGLFVAPFDALADAGVVGELAATAESAGWDGLFVWDHLEYGDRVSSIADPWICCAAVAMRTERLLFGPMVTPLARRRPQVLARQAASLAVLSGGRFVLGAGLGDDSVGELGDFGDQTDARARGRMLDEALEVVTGLLSGDPVDHEGEFFRASGVRFQPGADVPVWIAGRFGKQIPVRRAARHAGFFPISVPDPEALGSLRAELPGLTLVVDVQPDVDPAPWADAGADWVLTRIGPYDIDPDAAFAVASRGPQ